jgi:hypothetical protein
MGEVANCAQVNVEELVKRRRSSGERSRSSVHAAG